MYRDPHPLTDMFKLVHYEVGGWQSTEIPSCYLLFFLFNFHNFPWNFFQHFIPEVVFVEESTRTPPPIGMTPLLSRDVVIQPIRITVTPSVSMDTCFPTNQHLDILSGNYLIQFTFLFQFIYFDVNHFLKIF